MLLADSYWLMCCSNDSALSEFAVALFVRPSFSEHDLLKTPIIKQLSSIAGCCFWHSTMEIKCGSRESTSVCWESLIVYGNLIFFSLLSHSASRTWTKRQIILSISIFHAHWVDWKVLQIIISLCFIYEANIGYNKGCKQVTLAVSAKKHFLKQKQQRSFVQEVHNHLLTQQRHNYLKSCAWYV